MSGRDQYDALLAAIGVCVAARVPFLLWGEPGAGKTSVVESAAQDGWHIETLIVSHHEPSDFAGLPVIAADGTVTFAPPQWAQRLASADRPGLAFFDEWTTAAPAVQAAALRTLTHGEVGTVTLPDTVSFGAAANPADVAAGGWELAPPTANRFVHLEWTMPTDVFTESSVTGRWPSLPVPAPGDGFDDHLRRQRVLVSGFLRARPHLLSSIPKDAAARGRAFPTPRTWDFVAKLLAHCKDAGLGQDVEDLLVSGAVGAATGHEVMTWMRLQDLPDPETLLVDPHAFDFANMRADRAFMALQGILAAVTSRPTAERWSAAVVVCARVADEVGVDPAVPVVRALVRPDVRPHGAVVPPEISTFAGTLALAGLLPGAA